MNASEKRVPRVSIVMPTYNRAALLERSVKSVLAQSFNDWELIVLDDASTDGTKALLDRFAATDARIRPVHHAKNYYPDISKTLNEGIELARAPYVARLDDDDYWTDPEKLAKQVAFLDAHPDHVVVGTGVVIVDPAGRELSRYLKKESDAEIRTSALFANPFSHTTVMFRTDVARRAGGYGAWRFAEDWDLWLTMGTMGKLYNLPEYCAAYTMTGENKSFVYLRQQTWMIFSFLWKHRKEYPGFAKAYFINALQWCYSLVPLALRRRVHPFLASLKRKSF